LPHLSLLPFPSFPTRRSSDLQYGLYILGVKVSAGDEPHFPLTTYEARKTLRSRGKRRGPKVSSHSVICLGQTERGNVEIMKDVIRRLISFHRGASVGVLPGS